MMRLFAEMDEIAGEHRTEPHQIPDHDQISTVAEAPTSRPH
jgi:hypothetical protein